MTPSQKARELADKFYNTILEDIDNYTGNQYATAKLCALRCVEEIINLPVFWDTTKNNKETGSDIFWYHVKQEIEKL